KPGAALAALLRAHELQPRRAAHLRNAATMATSIGLPNEALALLDGAARLEDQPLAGMGIGQNAAALAIRGQILGTMGRWAEAESALQAAVTAEPLLTEATAGLAAATTCRQGPAAGVKIQRVSRKRRTPVPPLDGSRGLQSPLRKAVLPGFPKQAAAMREVFRAENDTLGAEVQATADRHMALDVKLQALDATSTPAEQRRRRAIFSRIHTAHTDADLTAMQQRVDQLSNLALKTTYDFWGNADQPYRYDDFTKVAEADCDASPEYRCFERRMREQCRPALRIAHQTWLDQTMDTWRAADALHRAFSKRVSGYAANLSDPDAFALALLAIKEDEQALYGAIHGLAVAWTAEVDIHQDYCVTPDEPDALPSPEQGGEEASGDSCSPALNAMRGVFELGPAKLKIACEKVSLSGKWEAAPWLQAFAEISYSAKTGKVTIFAGSKGEVDSLKVVKGAFKSGIYITAGNKGIEDVGWRVGPSATVGKGPVEFEVFKDEIDMSFVGALDATFGR
ncbi:MAG: putative transcriptional regulator, partial [Solirubrobacterales bacterium]|nr:putative transcriptional regulator [Solirubrobacterales bacterium]